MTQTNNRSIDDHFTGNELDRSIWLPHYLPHWSSLEDSQATYAVRDGELRLSIPPDHPLWCPDLHTEPLRVSGIQSGHYSGPRGSTIGQQPFRENLPVREELPVFRGYLPLHGAIEVTMRATVDAASMVAFWLVGFEDQPERSGEICIAEIFGNEIEGETTLVGMGIHQFRDPTLVESFSKLPLRLDVTQHHSYGIEWTPTGVTFLVDGEAVHQLDQSPAYPMQLMVGVFDFPDKHPQADDRIIPELVVTRVHGSPNTVG